MEKSKPYLGQIIVQSSYAVLYVLSKLALDDGMNNFVFVTYRQAFATLVISPIAYFLERKQRRPMSSVMLFQIFLLACGISITQNCFAQGVYYTSSTFLAVAVNLIPIFTFLMATLVRLEKFDLRTLRGKAKVVGTVVCVSGAMVMTFYKGTALPLSSSSKAKNKINTKSYHNIILGSVLIYGGVIAWSAWLAFQGPILKRYPAQLSLTALTCLISALQSALIGIICEHNKWDIWVAKPNIQLITAVYSGVVCSALGFFLQSWSIAKKGPVFAGVFSPLSTIITALVECIVLGVSLHIGSVVGAVLIIIGLYAALWGKAEDNKKIELTKNKGEEENKCRVNNSSLHGKEESNV